MDVLFRVADPGGLRSPQRVSTIPIPRREPGRRQSPPQAKQESTKFPPLRRRPSPGKEMARLGISWVFPWAWTYSQVCRGPEELEGVRESCRARVEAVRGRTQKRRAARVRSPVRDRTLSRSCPAPKSKNFVSRSGTLRYAPCSFPPRRWEETLLLPASLSGV